MPLSSPGIGSPLADVYFSQLMNRLMKLYPLLTVMFLTVFLCSACAGALEEPFVAEGHEPVPTSEPRATLHIAVDLDRRIGCEEAFDLAVYSHRAVERIAWEAPSAASPCTARAATVTFVPGRLPQAELIALMRSNARSLEVRP